MVKVFLCDSAEACKRRLVSCVEADGTTDAVDQVVYCDILVPNDNVKAYVLRFYPCLNDKNVETPTSLLKKHNLTPLPRSVASLWNVDSELDPVCLNEKKLLEAENIQAWNVLANVRTFFSVKPEELKGIAKRLVVFGFFEASVCRQILNRIAPAYEECFVIKMAPTAPLKSPADSSITTVPFANTSLQYLWLERQLRKQPSTVISLQNTLPSFLTRKSFDFVGSAWLDWQAYATVGYFCIYLEALGQRDTSKFLEDLRKAQEACLSEDFLKVRQKLLETGKSWIEPFQCLLGEQPLPIGQWLQLVKVQNPPFEMPPLDLVIYTCPILYKRLAFFSFLRRYLTEGSEKPFLTFDQAVYFPWKGHLLILDGFQTTPEQDRHVLDWLSRMSTTCNITLCCPLQDVKNNRLVPLLPILPQAQPLQITSTLSEKTSLQLPPKRLHFACKTWERFYICPRRTWLINVLKTQPQALNNSFFKAKILGEWVHGNLQFKKKPATLLFWKEKIVETSSQRWKELQTCHNEIPYFLEQWHLSAQQMSLQMAQACETFLNSEWELYSEWPLPETAPIQGRIDLLAVHAITREAVIVDYKTAKNYDFKLTNIKRGQGLQLLLYGQQIQTIFQKITLMVILPDGSSGSLDLSVALEQAVDVQAWMQTIQTTGTYEPLPKESLETLPLYYCNKEA